MGNCKLCRLREADKTGAHVIPYFLLKDMVHSGAGNLSRDNDFLFGLGVLNTESYVGKSVLPDNIGRLLGKDFDPDQLKNKKNPITVDCVWCTNCEAEFAAIEGYYSSRSTFIDNNGELVNKCQSYISTLFWCSVLWRVAETDFFGKGFIEFSERESMRLLLSDTLNGMKQPSPEKLEHIKKEVRNSGFKYQISVETVSSEIEFIFVDSDCVNPAIMIANKRVILFYFKDIDSETVTSTLIPGISVFKSEAPYNFGDNSSEKALHIDFQIAEGIKNHRFNSLAAEWVDHIRWLANEAFQKFRGVRVPEAVVAKIMHELTSSEGSLTPSERYENQRVMKVISKNLYSALFSPS